jgi:predicted nuclease of predicted toxin-antitoxin system
MLRLATDVDVDGRIIAGLLLQQPDLNLVRLQDAGLGSQKDPAVLEWAAANDRILVSRDRSTMRWYAEARMNEGKSITGVFLLRKGFSVGKVIEEILIRALCTEQDEWLNIIDYIP